MNGIDKIAGKIATDARQEAESILAEARREAQDIQDQYEIQAKAAQDKIRLAGADQAREIQRRALSAADQEAKQLLLATKQKMIAQAFDQALEKLLALPQAEYVQLLAQLAAQAAGTGKEEIIMSSKEREVCGQQVVEQANQLLVKAGKAANLTLSAETRIFAGGLLLKSGDVEVNCTLDTLLRLSRENLALDVAATLFA